MDLGYVGVTFFFVLSGFILTWTHSPSDTARKFWSRRFARIYPVHLLTLVIAVVMLVSGLRDISGSPSWFVPQLLLVQSWIPRLHLPQFNAPSWSLSDESFFYLLFPLVLRRLPTSRLFPMALAILAWSWLLGGLEFIVLLFPRWAPSIYWFPGYRMGEFYIGVAVGLAFRNGWRPRIPLAVGVVVATSCYLAAWWAARLISKELFAAFWLAQPVCAVGFAVLIIASAMADIEGRASPFRVRWLVRLGQWSFALYMIHELVMRVVHSFSFGRTGSEVPYLLSGLVSIALAGAIYEWYERPIERRLRVRFGQGPSLIAMADARVVADRGVAESVTVTAGDCIGAERREVGGEHRTP